MHKLLFVTILLAFHAAHAEFQGASPPLLGYEIVETLAHDPRLFTQGLILEGEELIETSGGYGKSAVIAYDAKSGAVRAYTRLPNALFAEGVERVNDRLVMLTWQENLLLELDPVELTITKTVPYAGQGWGIAFNGKQLITSDGSDILSFRNPESYKVERAVQVTSGKQSWRKLNELEFADGWILANVWQRPIILVINPADGNVAGLLDLSELEDVNSQVHGHTVLNGIAFDEAKREFWVTGKNWPNRYKIKISMPNNLQQKNQEIKMLRAK